MPGLSGLSNQSCERRSLPRADRVFGFFVMTILDRFRNLAGGCAERRARRKAVQSSEIGPKRRPGAAEFRHGFVIEILRGPRCYFCRATRIYAHRRPFTRSKIVRAT